MTALVVLLARSAVGAEPASAPATTAAGVPAAVAVPSVVDQQPAIKTFQEVYAAAYAKTDAASRAALARQLVDDGKAERFDPVLRYVVLQKAAEAAILAGDGVTAARAADVLAERFTGFDALATKVRYVADAAAARVGPTLAAETAVAAAELAYVCVAADRFDQGDIAAKAAETSAARAGRVALVTSTREKLADYRAASAEAKAVAPLREAIKVRPDDAAANGKLGRFHAFYRNDFVAALPLLARSDDATLRPLAEAELARPDEVTAKIKLGDGWWDVAAAAKGLPQASAARHACLWYRAALPELAKSSTRSRLETRLKSGVPAAETAAEAQAAKVDLLALLDPEKDAVAGAWKLGGTPAALSSNKDAYSRLEFPLRAPEEYDLRVVFVRSDGDGPVAILLTGPRETPFGVALDISNKARLEAVDGNAAKDNPTVTKLSLTNDRKYVATVQVRKDSVRVLLDDKPLIEHKTDYKDLSRYKPWKLRDDTLLGVGVNNARVTVFKFELIVVSGRYHKTR